MVQSDVFTETRLNQDIPDDNVSISGLQPVQADRDHTGEVNVKEEDLLILSTTAGVMLLDSGHIISPGVPTRH